MASTGSLLLSGSIPGPLRSTLSVGSAVGPGPPCNVEPQRTMMGLAGSSTASGGSPCSQRMGRCQWLCSWHCCMQILLEGGVVPSCPAGSLYKPVSIVLELDLSVLSGCHLLGDNLT